ncbi:MAG: S28 family serine protease [Proteobacteria bacterium]|nr:S28 family serine protease [Pseudomonadota bacterium]
MRWALVFLWVAACGDNEPAAPDAPPLVPDAPGDIVAQLDALPGVTAPAWTPPDGFPVPDGYRYIDVWFTQPIDHAHPELGTFQQYAAIMHRDTTVTTPVVLYTSGYEAGWRRYRTEPTELLAGNQVSLEYRFYGTSKPVGDIDWSKLTVEQAMADEHAVLALLRPIYDGAVIETGGSKGGENAMAHMHAYPDDLDGVVAYVAPVITSLADARYDGILDRIGLADCRAKLRAVARELLLRRVPLEAIAMSDGETYARAGLDHAFETAVVELEFSFWMTRGEGDCGQVPTPAADASDVALYNFLYDTGGAGGYADAVLDSSGQQYIYQDQAELGYPVWNHGYLDDLMTYSYEDWTAYMPTSAQHPTYAPAQAMALATYLASAPTRIMHVGGEWDPWSAGYPTIATTHDAFDYRVAHGSHWSSGIYSLAPADQLAATTTLRRWGKVATAKAVEVPVRAPLASMATLGPAPNTRHAR